MAHRRWKYEVVGPWSHEPKAAEPAPAGAAAAVVNAAPDDEIVLPNENAVANSADIIDDDADEPPPPPPDADDEIDLLFPTTVNHPNTYSSTRTGRHHGCTACCHSTVVALLSYLTLRHKPIAIHV
eukprot:TRINITY_DN4001_c0_g1_i24.p2 TRINITY_DN4001_c0_g1~~TRINITY_DN4001_c0_g1_i24.p2  ORF type:complete len:126 (-),score=17.46 TRINITY_DN4001_c0_g1_i24:443-820(-)